MNSTYVETPKKARTESKKKKREYRYKNRSTLVLYFSNLSAYTKHFKTVYNRSMVQMQCQEATNVLVWIAKQNRYMILKGYFTPYQLDIIEVEVENRYLRGKKNAWIDYYNPTPIMDMSHVPPTAEYVND